MLLAVLQGVSELFPISSLGHTVLIPPLLHWNVDESDESFLAFVVVLHLGTAIALIVFYRNEWVRDRARVRRAASRADASATIATNASRGCLVVGTIPVGILGVLFQSAVRGLFASPIPVAVFLMLNAGIMFAGEALRQRQRAGRASRSRSKRVTLARSGASVGVAQSARAPPGHFALGLLDRRRAC